MGRARLTIGELFADRFRVESVLAEGGMGVIYVVTQVTTNQRLALKTLNAESLRAPELRARFLAEARATPADDSDHVVRVLDAGVDAASDRPWILMELLDGCTLGAWIASRGPLSPPDALEVFRQLAHGVGVAHARGVVHRDLKPDNVFIHRRRDVSGGVTVKVLDFGVAKAMAGERRGASILVGTPGWAAPEQMTGHADITPATDVWALGLLAFFLLTGQSYLDPSSGLSPRLPTARERARALGVEARVPDGFDAWFTHCVTWDVSQRFSHANAAQAALAGALGLRDVVQGAAVLSRPQPAPSSPQVSTPPPPVVRTARAATTSKGRWAAAVVSMLVCAVAAALAWRPVTSSSSTPAPDTTRTSSAPPPALRDTTSAPLASEPALDARVADWIEAVHRPSLDAVQDVYASQVRFRGGGTVRSGDVIRRYWSDLLARPGAHFVVDRTSARVSRETLDASDPSHSACAALDDASGDVMRVSMTVDELDPARPTRVGNQLPCARVAGEYVLRFRAVRGRWMICNDTWSQCQGVCASCPQASGCGACAR